MNPKIIFVVKIIFSLILFIFLVLFLIRIDKEDLIISVITLLALFGAIFKEDLYNFFRPPNLKIVISNTPEHLQEAQDEFGNEESWLGVDILNNGLGNAKNLKVYFNGINSNVIEDFSIYKSLPLRLGWVGEDCIKLLHPKLSTRWDICYLRKAMQDEINFSFLHTPDIFSMIFCKKNKVSFFEFEIVVTADNMKPVKQTMKVEFLGKYTEGFKVKIKKYS